MTNILSLPNILTLMRIVLIPIFIVIFYMPFDWAYSAAAFIFALASFTDWLDGYLARKLHQISPFGAFLDPVADKLLVACTLVLVISVKDIDYITIPAIVIIGREIIISGLREWMAEIGQRASITVSYISKVKTALQMVAIFLLVGFDPSTSWLGVLGFVLLYVAAILTIWTMVVYLMLAGPELLKKNHN